MPPPTSKRPRRYWLISYAWRRQSQVTKEWDNWTYRHTFSNVSPMTFLKDNREASVALGTAGQSELIILNSIEITRKEYLWAIRNLPE